MSPQRKRKRINILPSLVHDNATAHPPPTPIEPPPRSISTTDCFPHLLRTNAYDYTRTRRTLHQFCRQTAAAVSAPGTYVCTYNKAAAAAAVAVASRYAFVASKSDGESIRRDVGPTTSDPTRRSKIDNSINNTSADYFNSVLAVSSAREQT